ncbi:MAG: hypothetical protein IPO67_30710 [Deltaproteobacteria bacterium]|nr:hypothetical protein [Deltaproteobacteria bacterium]
MSAMIVLWLGIGGANAETLTCAGATLSLTSCSDGEVNIDCGAQTSCTVAAKLDLTSGSCIVQRVGSCEVTVVASSSSTPAFSVSTASGKTADLTLREIQPQCGNSPFVFVEPKETAGATTVTLEGLRATTACSKDGPLLATSNSSGTPPISVSITGSVLTGWTSEGWDSSDPGATNEGGLLSLDNTALTLTGSVLADNTLSTASTGTGGGFISAVGASSVLSLTNNLFVLSNAATQDLQGAMFRFTSGAQATLSHNVFIDKAGVTADYAPLINVGGEAAVTLEHNLFSGASSSVAVGTLDESIPTLNHNLFVGLTTPWVIEGVYSTGTDVFDPLGANNWAQSGVTNDVGGPLTLGDLQLVTLAALWADLYPGDTVPTSPPFMSDYDGVDPTTLALWPDSCSPLLDLDPVPGVLGGGGGEVWDSVLDVTTAYAVPWYCSVVEDDGTLCFEENADHCAARADGDTCKTTFIIGEDECEPPPARPLTRARSMTPASPTTPTNPTTPTGPRLPLRAWGVGPRPPPAPLPFPSSPSSPSSPPAAASLDTPATPAL